MRHLKWYEGLCEALRSDSSWFWWHVLIEAATTREDSLIIHTFQHFLFSEKLVENIISIYFLKVWRLLQAILWLLVWKCAKNFQKRIIFKKGMMPQSVLRLTEILNESLSKTKLDLKFIFTFTYIWCCIRWRLAGSMPPTFVLIWYDNMISQKCE